MMKAAIFGKNYNESFKDSIIEFFKIIKGFKYEILIYEPYYQFIKEFSNFDIKPDEVFNSALSKKDEVDIVFSIGGDGTFLESVSFVRDLQIPVVGINSGRLGFLANISQNNIPAALNAIHEKKYSIEERTLLEVNSNKRIFKNFNFALNEITVQKRDSGSMITIKVFLNGEFVNTYWADGLILSTPTGSTAYSLSLGGPIVVPGSQNFILTPIAPHNLTVRPIVVPDDNEITIEVSGRTDNYLVSADYQAEIVEKNTILTIKAANFKVKTIRIENHTFFNNIREKLLWGLDKRN
ncbi:MAG: NAD kinase [Bacteroidales bacterium]|nr:NAD kinase [Bacteroidales bacterium]